MATSNFATYDEMLRMGEKLEGLVGSLISTTSNNQAGQVLTTEALNAQLWVMSEQVKALLAILKGLMAEPRRAKPSPRGERPLINKDLAEIINSIILDAQIRLRALRDVAHESPTSGTIESYEAVASLAVSVAERVHQMLDSCLSPLGMIPIGCYENDFQDVAKALTVELPPALLGQR
ncbi:MAG TPA: hypothetical protein VHA15_14145 [Burkholderiales bacterium]|nr:hypothetical protein [Burkholderiales bacterium]